MSVITVAIVDDHRVVARSLKAYLHLARVQEADELTPREGDVLRHLAVGASNRTIAAALNVSEETVKTHVANVLAKLQVENRAQAAVQALKRGLVSIDDVS